MGIKITAGNVDDRAVLPDISRKLKGKVYATKVILTENYSGSCI